jgi:hypothetical protein
LPPPDADGCDEPPEDGLTDTGGTLTDGTSPAGVFTGGV